MNFPPIAVYDLTCNKGQGNRLIASGNRAVYVKRIVRDTGSYDPPRRLARSDSQRLLWVAELLQTEPKHLPFQLDAEKTLVWRGANRFVKDIRREQAIVIGAFRGLITRLASQGLCEPSLKTTRPDVEIHVCDDRPEDRVELPIVRDIKMVVEIEEEEMEENP